MNTIRYWIAAAIATAAMPWTSHPVWADGSDQPVVQSPEQAEQEAECQQQNQGQNCGG